MQSDNRVFDVALLALIGAFFGIFIIFSPAGCFVALLFLAILFAVGKLAKPPARKFLSIIFISGFMLRAFLGFLNYEAGLIPPFTGGDTQPDAVIYNGNAFYIAHVLTGGLKDEDKHIAKDPFIQHSMEKGLNLFAGELPKDGTYQYSDYVFLVGVFYSLFGYAPVAAKLLNGLIGCMTAILIYVFAKTTFGSEKAAKIAAVLTMFFPSMVYWSATLLQDSLVNFLFLAYISAAVFYLKNKGWHIILSALISCAALSALKYKLTNILLLSFAVLLAMKALRIIFSKKILLKIAVLLMLLVVVFIVIAAGYPRISDFMQKNITLALETQKSSATAYPTASSFRLYHDRMYENDWIDLGDFYNISVFFIMLKALTYYFLAPFPWTPQSLHPLLMLFYPQVVFTFICLPFMAIGTLGLIRRDSTLAIALIILLAMICVPQSLAEGIIGNVVRHRDMFMPFIIAFASYGFCMISDLRSKKVRGSEK